MGGSDHPVSQTGEQLCAEYSSHFRVGGVSVRLASDDVAKVALVPSLVPFQAEPGFVDIYIRIEPLDEVRSLPASQVFDSGSVWQMFEDEAGFRFDFNAPAFGDRPYKRLFVDSDFSRAILQMSQQVFRAFPSVAPLDYPLDELLIMHRLTQEKAIELHGCGIVCADGIANLFVGHSGAGKSTTTRLWTSSRDVEVLSDDRIILRRDDESKKQVPRFARNDKTSGNDDLVGNGKTLGISAFRTGVRMYGTPWHGEAMYASPNSAPLARILVLEHGHGNVLTPLSPSEAVAELFARSFVPFHRHEYVDSALAFLEEVVDAVPVYHYAFEPDQRAVDTILNLHD